ncbi:MAG: orotate phosphoribosyltransferase [Planctomycetes bacterium]|nr:orotate phosphoribosyltransferase [Planctomycetota bacterium]
MVDKLFTKLGAIQNGHFILTSGKHSDTYVQCARILERPDVTAELIKQLCRPYQKSRIDAVAGPAVGGIIISYEIARFLKAKAVYMERVDDKLILRRGFEIKPGEQVIVAEDVITTGGSVKEVVDVITGQGGKVMGIIALVDRRLGGDPATYGGAEKTDLPDGQAGELFGIRFDSIIKVTPPIYEPADCPLCRKGTPAVKPGSRGLTKPDRHSSR